MGHGLTLQFSESDEPSKSVEHWFPSKAGEGLSQFRVRVWVPGPQVAEQAENKLQAPQFPSTDKIKMTGGQKVDRNNNHEIKTVFVHEIKTYNNIFTILIRRLTLWSWDQNSLIMLFLSFDLMILLVNNKWIMRSKLKKAL
jgi:hypothetical protein